MHVARSLVARCPHVDDALDVRAAQHRPDIRCPCKGEAWLGRSHNTRRRSTVEHARQGTPCTITRYDSAEQEVQRVAAALAKVEGDPDRKLLRSDPNHV